MFNKLKLILGIILFLNLNNLVIAKENFFNDAKNKFDEKKLEESKFLFQRNIVFNPKDAQSYLYLAKIFNSEDNGLGIPLPAGKVEMYLTSKGGSREFSGEDYLVQTPKEGTVLLTAGRAFDITGKRTILNYDRQRNSEEASIQIQIKNIHDEAIQVRVVEHISGDWVIRDASSMYTKEDATTIYFPLNIDAEDNKIITYTYR